MKENEFLDGFSKKEILELLACGKCNECGLACPVFAETQNQNDAPSFRLQALKAIANTRYGFRALIFGSRKVSQKAIDELALSSYHCTLCGRCMTVCPYVFDLIDLWEKVREQVLRHSSSPTTSKLQQLMNTTVEEKNILGRPHTRRKDWMRRLDVPEIKHVDTIYFAGCTTSYIPSLRNSAKGITTILNLAKEDWATLSDEWCCGVPLLAGGSTDAFKEFAIHNIEMIEATGTKRVVFSCPGCYRMFKQKYPSILGRPLNFSVLHITELVNNYLQSGKIIFKKGTEKITYHDPCELSRLLGVIDPPRSVLSELSTSFRELPENKVNSLCCGSGGLFKAVDSETSLEIAQKRLQQAEDIGADTLISGCPSCITNLTQAKRFMKSNIQVLDFADAVARYIATT